MKITIVGPAPPLKGGIAHHTAELAEQLNVAGHEVTVLSWLRQYPSFLYPGRQIVAETEIPASVPVQRELSWNRPDTWYRAGRQLRESDVAVFQQVTPIQVPAYRLMLLALGGNSARTAIICHNVRPHEGRFFDRPLLQWLLAAADRVVVHSESEADLARHLTTANVVMVPLPPHMPNLFKGRAPQPGVHHRLLFFGIVRPYKGLDVLLRALSQGPPNIQLRVAGEFWGGTNATERLCRELGIENRVELRPDYIPAPEVPALFDDVDALVMPYRSATGSQAVRIGFQFGVPVIVSRVGDIGDHVKDGFDGFVVEPDDPNGLAEALRRFYEPGVAESMRAQVQPVDAAPYWERYMGALINLKPLPKVNRQETGLPLRVAKAAAEQVLWGRVALSRSVHRRSGKPRPFPGEVPPTAVLGSSAEYVAAVRECRSLGLPLHHDRPKNWDALGAVGTVLHRIGTDASVLDAGAARYSPILPWLRIYGVRDLIGNNLEFNRTFRHGPVTFEPGDITATTYADGRFDAVTCMSVIEHGLPVDRFLKECSRIIRPGGLLVLSTDYDQNPPDTTGLTAYGSPVKIFGPEEIRALVVQADHAGFDLVGDLELNHRERPVHWKRTGLDFTFIRLTFLRR